MTRPAASGEGVGAPRWTTRAQRRAGAAAAARRVDPAPLAGEWVNSDRGGGGLARLSIAVDGEGLAIAAWAAGEPAREAGRARGEVFAAAPGGGEALAFVARLDRGDLETLLAAYGKAGILVVDAYDRCRDGGGRAPVTRREFFRRG